jgi:hypothetical protein
MTRGLFVATLFLGGFRDDGGHNDRFAGVVKRDECQIRRRCVDDFAGARILDPDLHADFHRRPEDPVHARLQDQQLADMNRMQEAHMVHCGAHNWPAGMPPRRKATAHVDQLHDVTTQHIAERVRIVGQRHVRVLRA